MRRKKKLITKKLLKEETCENCFHPTFIVAHHQALAYQCINPFKKASEVPEAGTCKYWITEKWQKGN